MQVNDPLWTVTYKVDKDIFPNVKGSKLFVCGYLHIAELWCGDIWEIEPIGKPEQGFEMGNPFYLPEWGNFWNKKSGISSLAPEGTYLVEGLRLIEKVRGKIE